MSKKLLLQLFVWVVIACVAVLFAQALARDWGNVRDTLGEMSWVSWSSIIFFVAAFAIMKIPLLNKYWGLVVALFMSMSILMSYSVNSLGTYRTDSVLSRLQESFSANHVPEVLLYVFLSCGISSALLVFISLRSIKSQSSNT